MARFFKDEHDALTTRANALKDFSDLMFAELHTSEFSIEALAEHLNVEVVDVHEWLEGKSLPSQSLFQRLQVIIRGNEWYEGSTKPETEKWEAENSTWSKIVEFIREVENIQALKDVKLTRPKAAK